MRFILLLGLLLPFMTVQGEILTPQESLSAALQGGPMRAPSKRNVDLRLRHTFTCPDGRPAVYAFAGPENEGFILTSADDVAAPLLGYSDTGRFSLEEMPPAMKWWIAQYSREISYATANGCSTYGGQTRASNPAIAPLVKTQWDQGHPYNLMCPEINGVNCVTGCVATAMAQVMNYHGYPDKGHGVVSINLKNTTSPTELDLDTVPLRWSDMSDTYVKGSYTDAQAEAVARLMVACGYSVEMGYGTSESGAMSYNVGMALINNFGYNPNIRSVQRLLYGTDEWDAVIYGELAAGRPVFYSGQSTGGGHAFVCDGYDGNGYYHINWGWGGMSDGYFLLQSLNPSDLGIGGGTGGGFSYDQAAIIGIQPSETPSPAGSAVIQGGILTGNKSSTAKITTTIKGGQGWWNMSYNDVNVSFGVLLESEDGKQKTEVVGTYNDLSLSNVELGPRNGFTSFTFLFPASWGDGKYKATVAARDLSVNGADWVPVPCPYYGYNWFYVTKEGSKYTVEYQSARSLDVTDVELASGLYDGQTALLKVTVTNSSDIELTQSLAPVLIKQGTEWFVGGGQPLSLKAGETREIEIYADFEAQKGASAITEPTVFSLKFVNESTGLTLKKSLSVTMNPAVKTDISVVSASLVGQPTAKDAYNLIWYMVEDPSAMVYKATVENNGEYFGNSLQAFIFPLTGGTSLVGIELTPTLLLGKGEKGTAEGTFYFNPAGHGNDFFIALYYYESRYNQLEGYTLFRLTSSGVESAVVDDLKVLYNRELGIVTAGDVAELVVTTLDGRTAVRGQDRVDVSGIAPGIYVVTATDASGRTSTVKIRK